MWHNVDENLKFDIHLLKELDGPFGQDCFGDMLLTYFPDADTPMCPEDALSGRRIVSLLRCVRTQQMLISRNALRFKCCHDIFQMWFGSILRRLGEWMQRSWL